MFRGGGPPQGRGGFRGNMNMAHGGGPSGPFRGGPGNLRPGFRGRGFPTSGPARFQGQGRGGGPPGGRGGFGPPSNGRFQGRGDFHSGRGSHFRGRGRGGEDGFMGGAGPQRQRFHHGQGFSEHQQTSDFAPQFGQNSSEQAGPNWASSQPNVDQNYDLNQSNNVFGEAPPNYDIPGRGGGGGGGWRGGSGARGFNRGGRGAGNLNRGAANVSVQGGSRRDNVQMVPETEGVKLEPDTETKAKMMLEMLRQEQTQKVQQEQEIMPNPFAPGPSSIMPNIDRNAGHVSQVEEARSPPGNRNKDSNRRSRSLSRSNSDSRSRSRSRHRGRSSSRNRSRSDRSNDQHRRNSRRSRSRERRDNRDNRRRKGFRPPENSVNSIRPSAPLKPNVSQGLPSPWLSGSVPGQDDSRPFNHGNPNWGPQLSHAQNNSPWNSSPMTQQSQQQEWSETNSNDGGQNSQQGSQSWSQEQSNRPHWASTNTSLSMGVLGPGPGPSTSRTGGRPPNMNPSSWQQSRPNNPNQNIRTDPFQESSMGGNFPTQNMNSPPPTRFTQPPPHQPQPQSWEGPSSSQSTNSFQGQMSQSGFHQQQHLTPQSSFNRGSVKRNFHEPSGSAQQPGPSPAKPHWQDNMPPNMPSSQDGGGAKNSTGGPGTPDYKALLEYLKFYQKQMGTKRNDQPK